MSEEEKLRKDAARYRWLRDPNALWSCCFAETFFVHGHGVAARLGARWVREKLDAAIDSAIAKAKS